MKAWSQHLSATITAAGKRLRLAGAVIGVAILALGLTGIVQADTTPTTYYACVLNKIGTLRLISSSQSCTQYETEISWNNVGPQGPQGPAGPAGPQGLPGPTPNVQMITGPAATIGGLGATSANCPPNTKVVGGGFNVEPSTADVSVLDNRPDPSGSGWLLLVRTNNGNDVITITAYALCIS